MQLGSGASSHGNDIIAGDCGRGVPRRRKIMFLKEIPVLSQQNNMLTIPCSSQWAAIGLF